MSAPFTGPSLEEHLARTRALLRLVEHALQDECIGDVRSGAEICLSSAIGLIDTITSALPAKVLDLPIQKGGTR